LSCATKAIFLSFSISIMQFGMGEPFEWGVSFIVAQLGLEEQKEFIQK
jgi:hypothetical protein